MKNGNVGTGNETTNDLAERFRNIKEEFRSLIDAENEELENYEGDGDQFTSAN